MGPTGSGKTAIAVELVQQLPCEIISVDSALVYRGMNIGTAKPCAKILAIAPHRLLDICDPSEAYSAGRFREDALKAIDEIIAAGKIPLLVGGTMLYFRALQHGLSDLPRADAKVREEILEAAQASGWSVLHQRLQILDPLSAQRIHPHDAQRIQRALEIYYLSGKPATRHYTTPQQYVQSNYTMLNLAVLPENRQVLHQRLAERLQMMWQQGFINEVEELYQRGDLHAELPAMRAVGYRQVWQYLAGAYSYAEMQARALAATRQLAKRQLTWLRSWPDIKCFSMEQPNLVQQIINTIKTTLARR
jgi:tRNA dimethylallyltransferase